MSQFTTFTKCSITGLKDHKPEIFDTEAQAYIHCAADEELDYEEYVLSEHTNKTCQQFDIFDFRIEKSKFFVTPKSKLVQPKIGVAGWIEIHNYGYLEFYHREEQPLTGMAYYYRNNTTGVVVKFW